MIRFRRLLSLLGLALAAGCNNSSATAPGVTPSTAIQVDPAEFLGNVACTDTAGGMRLYVATLTDVSPLAPLGIDGGELVLPSSLPTSCHVPVLFESILDGRQYEAAVDGYDRDDIVPLAPGNRVMVDPATRTYIAPRWTTECAHRKLPPALSSDGTNPKPDAGVIVFADSGLYPNGGYLSCTPVPLYGKTRTPWLDGPVCAINQQTITARGCEPLHD
jgi:hypothetical protein